MARQGHRAVANLILLILCWIPLLHAASPTLPVIDLAGPEVDREDAARFLSKKLKVDAELKPPAPLLLESLRWATPDPASFACQSPGADAKAAWPFVDLLTRAAGQIAKVEVQDALESLKQARALLPCAPAVVPREQLRRLIELEAVGRLLLKDNRGVDLLMEVLSIDTGWAPDVDFPPKLVASYKTASKGHARLKFHTIDISSLPGEAFVDGEGVKNSVALYPGRHLVQVKGPNAEMRSALVVVPEKGPVSITKLADFSLPSAAVAREQLASSLRRNELDPYQTAGIDRYLTAEKLRVMTVFVEPAEELEAAVRLYEPGKGLVDLTKINVKKYFRQVAGD